ncbi:hypothetical protein BKA81DRAFT_188253 [Phyllosticta paracitricarpa]
MAEAAEGYHETATGKNGKSGELKEWQGGDSSEGPQQVELTRVRRGERMRAEAKVGGENARLKESRGMRQAGRSWRGRVEGKRAKAFRLAISGLLYCTMQRPLVRRETATTQARATSTRIAAKLKAKATPSRFRTCRPQGGKPKLHVTLDHARHPPAPLFGRRRWSSPPSHHHHRLLHYTQLHLRWCQRFADLRASTQATCLMCARQSTTLDDQNKTLALNPARPGQSKAS